VEVQLVSLVDNVMIILGLVVVSWRVVVIPDMISIFMLRTIRSSHPLPMNTLLDILVGLGLMRLLVFCVL